VLARGAGFLVWMALVLLNIIRMDFLWTGGSGRHEYFGLGEVFLLMWLLFGSGCVRGDDW
jgi:hypothetical protein